ncbi:MAG: glycoside hydrolase [Frankiales bacterium]|nr:glycoside hydrolase [Frankiales bacterium]
MLMLAVVVPVAVATPAEASTSLNQRAVNEAAKHYGAPYKYGAAGPSRFDCSGFTRYVFGRLGRSLPHSSAAQYNAPGVHHISRSQVRPGDLVFTIRSGSIRHVAIYAGSNAMWAATETGDIVRKQPLSGRTLVFARVG